MNQGNIYFLMYKKKVVYIGKSSVSVENRVKDHKKIGKMFDSYRVLETTTLSDMHWLEVYLITKYKPFYNKDCKELDEVSIDLGIDLDKLKTHKVANANNSSVKVSKFLKNCSYLNSKDNEKAEEEMDKEQLKLHLFKQKVTFVLHRDFKLPVGVTDFKKHIQETINKFVIDEKEETLPQQGAANYFNTVYVSRNIVDTINSYYQVEYIRNSKFVQPIVDLKAWEDEHGIQILGESNE